MVEEGAKLCYRKTLNCSSSSEMNGNKKEITNFAIYRMSAVCVCVRGRVLGRKRDRERMHKIAIENFIEKIASQMAQIILVVVK